MQIIKDFIYVLKNRKYYLWKYTKETFMFTFNYILLRVTLVFNKNVQIGYNPRILSFNCFKAEKPDGKIEIGDDVIVYYNSEFSVSGKGSIKIGDYCTFGSNLRLYCKENISIGNFVLIYWNVFITDYDAHSLNFEERQNEIIYSHNRLFPRFSRKKVYSESEFKIFFSSRPVIIEDNVWIGYNAVILKGVRVGKGSVVGARAVVTKDVPPYSIVAGNPAKVVKQIRKDTKELFKNEE